MHYDEMTKAELTKLGIKYTKNESNELKGAPLAFAKWVYSRRRGNPKNIEFFAVLREGNNNCFHYFDDENNCLERMSFAKAIRNQDDKGEQKTRVLEAFRWAIDDTIKPLRKKGMHVDHIIPFHIILSDFMLDRQIGFSDIEIHSDLLDNKQLSDSTLKAAFKEYHDSVAKLRVIPAKDNLVKGATEDLAVYRYRLKRGETYDKF